MLSSPEAKKMSLYCQRVIQNLRTPDEQPWQQEKGWIWCDDWEVIELCKCLFNGIEGYRNDPPPRRLRGNPLWSQEAIIAEATKLARECGGADKIIALFETRRSHA